MIPRATAPRVGRYELHGEIAAGGMATVYYGRIAGALGFTRTVAIKRIHPHLAKNPDFVSMFVDEVRLAARVQHPNVVRTLDVVLADGEAFLVMEHVLGEPLSQLIRAARNDEQSIPVEVSAGIMCGILQGLHAAHEAKSERGDSLHIVHRDVSPQNLLLGADGIPRLIDFGVAKGAGRVQTTGEGQIKGKFAYMSPEQLVGDTLDRRSDIYSAGVVLWELLAGRALIEGGNNLAVLQTALSQRIEPPSQFAKDLPPGLDSLVMRALAREPEQRFPTALQMASALEAAVRIAGPTQLADWAKSLAGTTLANRARVVAEIERGTVVTGVAPLPVTADVTAVDLHSGVSTVLTSSPSLEAGGGRVRPARVALLAVLAAAGLAVAGFAATRRHAGPAAAPQPPERIAAATASPTSPTALAAAVGAVAAPPATSDPLPPPARAGGRPRSWRHGASPSKAPRAPAARPTATPPPTAPTGGGDCRVEQYVDGEGFVRFRCAP